MLVRIFDFSIPHLPPEDKGDCENNRSLATQEQGQETPRRGYSSTKRDALCAKMPMASYHTAARCAAWVLAPPTHTNKKGHRMVTFLLVNER